MKITRRQLRRLIIESVEDLRDHAYRRNIQIFTDALLNDQNMFADAIDEYEHQIVQSAEFSDGGVLNLHDVYINCRDFGLAEIKAEYFDSYFGGLDDMVRPYQDEMGGKFVPHNPDINDYSKFMTGKLVDTGLVPDKPIEVSEPLSDLENKAYESEWSNRAQKLRFQYQKEEELGVDKMIDMLNIYLTNYTILNMEQQGLLVSDDMLLFKRISNDVMSKHFGTFSVKN